MLGTFIRWRSTTAIQTVFTHTIHLCGILPNSQLVRGGPTLAQLHYRAISDGPRSEERFS